MTMSLHAIYIFEVHNIKQDDKKKLWKFDMKWINTFWDILFNDRLILEKCATEKNKL